MKTLAPWIAAGVGLALCASAARAADSDTDNDLRCMVVAGAVAGSPNPQLQAAAPLMMSYYLGRAKGREPGIDIGARLEAAYRGLKASGLQADAQRCGAEMAAMGKETQDLAAKFHELAVKDQSNPR